MILIRLVLGLSEHTPQYNSLLQHWENRMKIKWTCMKTHNSESQRPSSSETITKWNKTNKKTTVFQICWCPSGSLSNSCPPCFLSYCQNISGQTWNLELNYLVALLRCPYLALSPTESTTFNPEADPGASPMSSPWKFVIWCTWMNTTLCGTVYERLQI